MNRLQLLTCLFVFLLVTFRSGMANEKLNSTKDLLASTSKHCDDLNRNSKSSCQFKNVSEKDVTASKGNECHCDDLCHDYGDCCLDMADFSEIHGSPWSCVSLVLTPNSEMNDFYVYKKCKSDYESDDVRRLCEENVQEDVIRKRSLTYLYYLPVFGKLHSRLYRNQFCAACNDETDIYDWKMEVRCVHEVEGSNYTFSQTDYLPDDRIWSVSETNSDNMCAVYVSEFLNADTLVNDFKARRCLLSCPDDWPDIEIRRLCEHHFSPVYLHFRNSCLVFRNHNCTLCNNIEDYYSHYVLPPSDHPLSGYPELLDFNFASGSVVGKRCNENELYCRFLDRCVTVRCSKGFDLNENVCVLKPESILVENQNQSHDLSCLKAVLRRKEFSILQNKSIHIFHSGKVYSPTEYEILSEFNGSVSEIVICQEKIQLLIDFNSVQQLMSEIFLIISIVCLLIMLTIYLIVPSLRNLPGKILMSLSASLTLGNTLFLVGFHIMKKPSLCHITGVLKHYSFLATFCWMNVMAVDIFRTFRRTSAFQRNDPRRTFYRYSTYAWWSPAVLVLASVLVDTFAPECVVKPKYGKGICWFNQKEALLLFFAVPVGIILMTNIVLFVLTAISILKTSRHTKCVNKFSEKVRFYLYIKIALILGFTWISGFIAAIADVDYLWYPFIVLSGLQGAFIFVAFTLKMKVFRSILKQLISEKKRSRDKSASPNRLGECSKSLSTSNLNITKSTSMNTSSNGSGRLTVQNVQTSSPNFGKARGITI